MYPEEERGTALSTYALGIPIGAAVGTLLGGWIGEYFGWRVAFMVVGLPGVIVAIVVFFTVREPPRGHSEPDHVQVQKDLVPLADTIQIFMGTLKAFRHLSFAGALHAFVGYGVGLFIPAFYMRVHGFGLAETSTYLFFIGLTGIIGTYLGGYLGDRMGMKDKRWYMGGSWYCDAHLCAVRCIVLYHRRPDAGDCPGHPRCDTGADVSRAHICHDPNIGTACHALYGICDPFVCIEPDRARAWSCVCGLPI